MLAVLLFAILLGSINYDNALGYMLTFLLGGLYLVGILHTYHNLAGLRIKRIDVEAVFAGEFMHFDVSIENPRASDKIQLTVSVLSKMPAWFRRGTVIAEASLPAIAGRATGNVILAIKARKRGWYELPRIKVATTFPLGIFVAWGYFQHNERCLVYPKADGQAQLPPPQFTNNARPGGGGKGDEDFRGLEPYTAGDPIKRIAWRALAKTDELLVKRFDGDSEMQLMLDWQLTNPTHDLEQRISQLCLWIVVVSRTPCAYGLALPDVTIKPDLGDSHRKSCLTALAEFR